MTACIALLLLTAPPATDEVAISLDAGGVLNAHADEVGLWLNSVTDTAHAGYVAALRSLRLKSIRYGWGFGAYDAGNTASLRHTPGDPRAQGFFTRAGRMSERLSPARLETLLGETGAVGFGVCATDAINYAGSADAALAAQSQAARTQQLAGAAAAWAKASREVRYFEIGNENDLSGGGEVEGIIQPWTPAEYAAVLRAYRDAIKAADPSALCGLNGGLKGPEEAAVWFEQIVRADPGLASDLDFLVAHQYEFWLTPDVWRQHADWEFGRVGQVLRDIRNRLFPTLPIQVTELGAFKEGRNDAHLRAVLQCEMLGNVRLDAAVRHVQVWPSRWMAAGGVLNEDASLAPLGLGMAAYTRHAQPIMAASTSGGSVRAFVARSLDGGSVTLWLVNHAAAPVRVTCTLGRLGEAVPVTTTAHEQLISPSDGATAGDTVLQKQQPITREGGVVRTTVPGTAVSVLRW